MRFWTEEAIKKEVHSLLTAAANKPKPADEIFNQLKVLSVACVSSVENGPLEQEKLTRLTNITLAYVHAAYQLGKKHSEVVLHVVPVEAA